MLLFEVPLVVMVLLVLQVLPQAGLLDGDSDVPRQIPGEPSQDANYMRLICPLLSRLLAFLD